MWIDVIEMSVECDLLIDHNTWSSSWFSVKFAYFTTAHVSFTQKEREAQTFSDSHLDSAAAVHKTNILHSKSPTQLARRTDRERERERERAAVPRCQWLGWPHGWRQDRHWCLLPWGDRQPTDDPCRSHSYRSPTDRPRHALWVGWGALSQHSNHITVQLTRTQRFRWTVTSGTQSQQCSAWLTRRAFSSSPTDLDLWPKTNCP